MKIRRERNDCGGLSAGSYGRTDQPWRSQRSVEMKQAVHGWLSTYERLVKSQKFFSSYLTQEDSSKLGRRSKKVIMDNSMIDLLVMDSIEPEVRELYRRAGICIE